MARALALRSLALGVAGKADVVEFHDGPPGTAQARPFPVEYKRGDLDGYPGFIWK